MKSRPVTSRHQAKERFFSNGSRASGLTIIEIMVVLAIVAIFATLAVPSFADFVRQIRLGSNMSDLTSDIQLARSESIKRNARVLFCARQAVASNACSTSGSATAWMNGWLVCYDADADGACDAGSASDPNPIRRHAELAPPLSLTGPTAAVIFFPVGNSNAAATFTMVGGTPTTRTTTVAPSGNVTTSKS